MSIFSVCILFCLYLSVEMLPAPCNQPHKVCEIRGGDFLRVVTRRAVKVFRG
jgi:hypothetical protein